MKKISHDNMAQIFSVNIVMALFWDLALLSDFTEKTNIPVVIMGTLFINACLIYEVYRLFFVDKYWNVSCMNFISFIKKKYVFFIICIIFIIISLTTVNAWLNLDGFLYYTVIRNLNGWELGRFDRLMLAGHNCQAYTVLLLIGEFLTPDNVLGIRIVHYVMALVSVYCIYETVETVVKERDTWECALYTSIFAFSPMLIGLISEINTDFPQLCFLTCMVCCGIRKKYILQAVFGLMLCFSKETGFLLYGGYIFGIVLYRFIKERKSSIAVICKRMFSFDIWLSSAGGILWLTVFFVSNSSGWLDSVKSQTQTVEQAVESTKHRLNSFGFFPEYIIVKFRQLIFVNSYWVLYFLILIMLSFTLIYGKKFFLKNIKMQGEILLGVILSFGAFLTYNSFYITYTGYRYLMPFVFFASFGAIISVADLFNRKSVRKAILTILVMVALVSDFCSIDPFSKYFFQCQGTGTGDILIPGTTNVDFDNNLQLNDKDSYGITTVNTGGMYNLQYAYLGICFDKTLSSINYDENTLIILPQQYRDASGTFASIFGVNCAGITEVYWDTKLRQTNINCADLGEKMSQDKRYQLINVEILVNLSELEDSRYEEYDSIYYIELPFMKEFDHGKFLEEHKVLESKKIQYMCWKWKIDKLK